MPLQNLPIRPMTPKLTGLDPWISNRRRDMLSRRHFIMTTAALFSAPIAGPALATPANWDGWDALVTPANYDPGVTNPWGIEPRFLPTRVEANAGLAAGDIHVDAVARYLYHIQDDGTAMRYGVAIGRNDLREIAWCDLVRPLEQQMLQEVCDAGTAHRFIRRPEPVPDHVDHDRRAVVGDHHDLHAIVETEGFGIEESGRCAIHGPDQQQRHQQKGKKGQTGRRGRRYAGQAISPYAVQGGRLSYPHHVARWRHFDKSRLGDRATLTRPDRGGSDGKGYRIRRSGNNL